MKYKAFLLFGAPGSGKGTQGKIIGQIPGFYHCACGDVFRGLDLSTDVGKVFLQYSRKGELVPDEFTVKLWQREIQNMVNAGRFRAETDYLILDGIPRNLHQAQMMADMIDVVCVLHLTCPDRSKIFERLQRRALKDNRLDDVNEETIRHRLEIYDHESKPILNYYPQDRIIHIDSSQSAVKVLSDILKIFIEVESKEKVGQGTF